MTPQQEHAITETALRMRKAEKEYYSDLTDTEEGR